MKLDVVEVAEEERKYVKSEAPEATKPFDVFRNGVTIAKGRSWAPGLERILVKSWEELPEEEKTSARRKRNISDMPPGEQER